MEKLLKTQFKPEFLNRLDEVVFYTPLTRDQISGILQLMLKDLSGRLADRHLSVELTDAAKEYVIDNGYDPVYGARPLKRFLQRAVETPIARMLDRRGRAGRQRNRGGCGKRRDHGEAPARAAGSRRNRINQKAAPGRKVRGDVCQRMEKR